MVNATLINATEALVNATNSTLLGASVPAKQGFLQILVDNAMLSFIIPAALISVIMLLVVRNVMPISHFLYANATIQARSNYMVTDALVSELTGAKSLKEFRSLLRETTYEEELEKAKEDLRSFHVSLEKGSTDSIIELVKLSPDKSKPLLNAYLMFFEAKILKIIYRARLVKETVDEKLVHPIGNIDNTMLKHLLDTVAIADIGVVMEPTTYSKIFEKKYSSLEEFEVKIDEFVLNNFVDIINKTKMYDGEYIMDILYKKIDVSNILAIIKFRIRGMEKEKQKSLLVNNKSELCFRFDRMINAGTLNDFVEGVRGTIYHAPLKKALEKYEKDKALSHFENELYKFFKEFVVSQDLGHTLGPYPLFSYLIKREIELRNLYIISRGIDAGFSTEKVKEMVI
jgi:vacuolar-type H+-ATPase subunit C/Vma6|tara:strand:+ start:253 stop:1452 length:1200 start_codon:yes stop_codon:yes gene_type:complete